MMKRLICVLTIFFVMFGFVGCKDTEEYEMKGTFYTLQEAYDEGLLTVENLQSIADLHNVGTESADTLSSDIEESIKETAAANMRNDELSSIPEAVADGFLILRYYGTYNNSVAVIMNNPYIGNPAAIVSELETIAGVSFHYLGYEKIEIWKQK